MSKKVYLLSAGMTLIAAAVLVLATAPSRAGDDNKAALAMQETVKKIAAALKKGDKEGAKKLAVDAVKKVEHTAEIMHMFKSRTKDGMGVGEKPLLNPAKDSIEVMIREVARDVPAGVAKQAEALEATGYWIAAIGELSAARGWPKKDTAKRTKKAWNTGSEEMRELGIAFAKAAAAKGGQEIKAAAAKVNSNCNSCHTAFKD